MTQAELAALVHGLHLSCLVTWAAIVGYRGGALLREITRLPWRAFRMLVRAAPRLLLWHPVRVLVGEGDWRGLSDRDDQRWAAVVLLAGSQIIFAVRWLIYPEAVDLMPVRELAPWAVAYVVSDISAVLIAWTQGDDHSALSDRVALACHASVTALSLVAAAWTA